jgi:hypothetical protein
MASSLTYQLLEMTRRLLSANSTSAGNVEDCAYSGRHSVMFTTPVRTMLGKFLESGVRVHYRPVMDWAGPGSRDALFRPLGSRFRQQSGCTPPSGRAIAETGETSKAKATLTFSFRRTGSVIALLACLLCLPLYLLLTAAGPFRWVVGGERKGPLFGDPSLVSSYEQGPLNCRRRSGTGTAAGSDGAIKTN